MNIINNLQKSTRVEKFFEAPRPDETKSYGCRIDGLRAREMKETANVVKNLKAGERNRQRFIYLRIHSADIYNLKEKAK